MNQIIPAALKLRLLWVLGLWLFIAGAHADVIVYYSATSAIRGLNLDTGTESLYTTSPYTSSINALAANVDNGFVYYGAGTTVYYWNPLEGSESGSHHVMNDLSSASLQIPATNLNSGGGTYLDGIYYVAAEASNGAVTDIYALNLSSNGKQITGGNGLNLLTACNCTGQQLGGLGDITAIVESGQTVIYGATTNLGNVTDSQAGRWKFNVTAGTFTLLAQGRGGQMASDPFGEVYLTQGNNFHIFDKATGMAENQVASAPVLPYDTSAGITLDYGDAPESYGVAQHMRPKTSYNPLLGSVAPDNELFSVNSSSDGLGDDKQSVDDEDAIDTMPDLLDNQQSYAVTLDCTGSSRVTGWLDFSQNGTFERAERNANFPVSCSGGQVSLQWNGLSGLSVGHTFARFRTASRRTQVRNPTGHANDGEVEDYRVTITGTTTVASSCPAGQVGNIYSANNLPMSIGTNNSWTRSVIRVPDSVTVTDVNVLNTSVSGVSDSRTIMYLGFGGSFTYLNRNNCPGVSSFNLGFSDEATSSAVCPSTDGNLYKPVRALRQFNNRNSQGDWTLWIYDYERSRASQLDNWELELCHAPIEKPALGAAKSATVTDFEVTFDVVLQNIGDVELDSLSLEDNLDTVFGSGQYSVISPPQFINGGAGLTTNAGFNGSPGSNNLLDQSVTNTLAAGSSATVQFTVRVDTLSDQGAGYGLYSNQATVSGSSPLGTIVEDLSNSGTTIDADGDNSATGTDEDDPTPFALTPNFNITGTVFEDHGNDIVESAHNGVLDSGETGLAGVTVEIRNAVDPTVLIASSTTDTTGQYQFSLPFSLIGNALQINTVDTIGYQAISEKTGNAAVITGDVSDAQQRIENNIWRSFDTVDFGRVRLPKLTHDRDDTSVPGSTVLHSHTFTPGSSGGVRFITNALTPQPANPDWSISLIHDQNCNSLKEITEPVLAATSSVSATRDTDICVLAEVFISENATSAATLRYDFTATLTYSDASSVGHGVFHSVQNTDVTRSTVTPNSDLTMCAAGQTSFKYAASGLPKNIGSNAGWTTSRIKVPDDIQVTDVNVLNTAVSGVKSSRLIMYLGFKGSYALLNQYNCAGTSGFSLGFDDEASGSAFCPSTNGELYQPTGNLGVYDNQNSAGDWTLWIYDYNRTPSSKLHHWELELCAAPIENAAIGLAKNASVTGVEVTFDLKVSNIGDTPLSNFTLSDNLDTVFGAGNFVISSAPQIISGGSGLTINSGFTGSNGADSLLDTTLGNTLAIGEDAIIRFKTRIDTVSDRGSGFGVYQNQGRISASSPQGTSVSDLSDNGTEIDPDNDNNASGGDEDDPTPIVLTPEIQLAGTVFEDHGDGSVASAHDGQQQSNERGLSGITIEAYDTTAPGVLLSTATTNGAGEYAIELPYSMMGSSVQLRAGVSTSYLAISENTLNPARQSGSVTDNLQFVNITSAAGIDNVNFGRVRRPSWESNNDKTSNVGTSVLHSHLFRSYSSAEVIFSVLDQHSAPNNPDWSVTLYRDINCNGQTDPSDQPYTSGTGVSVSNDSIVCIIGKVFTPATVAGASRLDYQIQAETRFSDAVGSNHQVVHLVKNTDITRAISGGSGELKLTKRVENLTQSSGEQVLGQGQPGDRLRYSIKFENIGSGPISDLSITDVTPAFTILDLPIACPPRLPASTASCTLLTPATASNGNGFTGNIEWNLDGQLAPGASGWVEYFVVID